MNATNTSSWKVLAQTREQKQTINSNREYEVYIQLYSGAIKKWVLRIKKII